MARKPRTAKPRTKRGRLASSILTQLYCDYITFDFDVDTDIFDLEKFHQITGLKAPDKQWSAVLYAREEKAGYHVHFNGKVIGKEIELSMAYYPGSVMRSNPPFAEDAIGWLGSFFKEPKVRMWAYAKFRKPSASWRSRFNLPFRVTMTGSKDEVVIDGISLDLPKNPLGAEHGWLDSDSRTLIAAVLLNRSVRFSAFSLEDEVRSANESIRMFAEEVV